MLTAIKHSFTISQLKNTVSKLALPDQSLVQKYNFGGLEQVNMRHGRQASEGKTVKKPNKS